MITEPPELKILYGKATVNGIPIAATLELTPRCNLDCKMCYIHTTTFDRSRELTTEQWKRIIDVACENGTMFVLLTGGEPLLRKDFKELYLYCINKGMLVSVNTNGTLINDDMVAFFAKYPPLRLNISFYGMSYNTYHDLCDNGEMFEKTKNAIINCKQAGLAVKLNLTVSEYNCSDIKKIYDFAKENLINVQPSTYNFNPVRKGKCESCSFSRADAKRSAEFTLMCDRCRYSDDEFLLQVDDIERRIIKDKAELKMKKPINEVKPCRAGRSAFWISWEGKMMICGMMPSPAFDILNNCFADAWKSTRNYAVHVTLPSKCSVCEYRCICDVCVASCLSESGETSEPPEYQCECAKSLYSQMIKAREYLTNEK